MRLLIPLFLFLLTAAMASAQTAEPAPKKEVADGEEAPEVVKKQQEVAWAPVNAGKDGKTWIQLISGEWVRGEIKDLYDGTLTFDSDELKEFEYDWKDVLVVITSRPHTITTWNHDVYTGFIVARRGNIQVRDSEGELIERVALADISSMIEGLPRERNFWSGKVKAASTVRAGNSDQTDGSVSLDFNRRALITRLENSFDFSYAESRGTKTQESRRLNSTLDRFVSRYLFWRVAQYEYFRDPFQNIRARHTPGAGFGYGRQKGGFDWDVSAGLGWQYTQFESVVMGDSAAEEDFVAGSSLTADWDITKDLEWDLEYSISFPFANFARYTSHLESNLSLDLFWNLELDLGVVWERQNSPRADENGEVPLKDDVRTTTGLAWEF